MLSNRYIRFASLAALLLGCGEVGNDQEPLTKGASPTASASEAEIATCVTGQAGSGFLAREIPVQTAPFTLELDARVPEKGSDVLIGLSDGPAGTYSDLAAILRFNPDNRLDARNGGSYAASANVPSPLAARRQYRFDVDPAAGRYDVSIVSPDGVQKLADDFAFRSEQAGTTSLDHLNFVSDAGSFEACNVVVGDRCRTAAPGGGFSNRALPLQSREFTAGFTATPSAADIDGVVGFSAVPADAFNDLAVAVRFNPDGFIDARDGGGYTAEQALPYTAGQSYSFRFIVDLSGHAYDVYVDNRLLGRKLAFRSEQQNQYFMDNAAVIADSDAGSLEVCDLAFGDSAVFESLHNLEAYPAFDSIAARGDGSVVVANATSAFQVNWDGTVAQGVPYGGAIESDSDANYLFGSFTGSYDGGLGPVPSAGGSDAYVGKYAWDWTPIYTRTFGGAGDEAAGAHAVNYSSGVALLAGNELVRLDRDGNTLWSQPVTTTGTALDLDGDGHVFLGTQTGTTFSVSELDATGALRWQRQASVTEGHARFVDLGATFDGGVAFIGMLYGTVSVDGTSLTARRPDGDETFLYKLDGGGHVLFARVSDLNSNVRLAVDGAGRLTLSGLRYNPDRYHLEQYATEGGYLREISGQDLLRNFQLWGVGLAPVADPWGNVFLTLRGSVLPDEPTAGYLAKITTP